MEDFQTDTILEPTLHVKPSMVIYMQTTTVFFFRLFWRMECLITIRTIKWLECIQMWQQMDK